MAYPWKNWPHIPRSLLAFWHMYEPAVSGHNIIYDYSGNARDITSGAGNAAVLTSNVFNGQPGWYFNGSRDPLSWSGSLTLKKLYILAAAEGAAFDESRGLLTGPATGDVLVSNNTGTKFFDLGHSPFEYKKAGVVFAQNNQQAPMNGVVKLLEVTMSGGLAMDGVRVGQQRGLAGRLWKGWFLEDMGLHTLPNESQDRFIKEYYAMRYWAWEEDSNGRSVFPFAANKTRALERDREHYLSEPYTGDPTALIRGNFKSGYSLQFLLREEAEWDAAKAFWEQHYPLTPFVFRDYRYYPARDVVVRPASELREQGSDVTYRFNYSFDVIEVA